MLEGVPRGGSSQGFFQASSLLVVKIQRHGEDLVTPSSGSMLHEMSITECGDKPTLIAEIWLMLICCERKIIFVC